MKIELNEEASWAMFGTMVILCLCAMGINGCYNAEITKRKAMELGYEESQNIGTNGARYTKAKP